MSKKHTGHLILANYHYKSLSFHTLPYLNLSDIHVLFAFGLCLLSQDLLLPLSSDLTPEGAHSVPEMEPRPSCKADALPVSLDIQLYSYFFR